MNYSEIQSSTIVPLITICNITSSVQPYHNDYQQSAGLDKQVDCIVKKLIQAINIFKDSTKALYLKLA